MNAQPASSTCSAYHSVACCEPTGVGDHHFGPVSRSTGHVDRRHLGLLDHLRRYLPNPSKGAPPDGHARGGHGANWYVLLGAAVTASPMSPPHLGRVHVESGAELDVPDVVTTQPNVHQAGDELPSSAFR